MVLNILGLEFSCMQKKIYFQPATYPLGWFPKAFALFSQLGELSESTAPRLPLHSRYFSSLTKPFFISSKASAPPRKQLLPQRRHRNFSTVNISTLLHSWYISNWSTHTHLFTTPRACTDRPLQNAWKCPSISIQASAPPRKQLLPQRRHRRFSTVNISTLLSVCVWCSSQLEHAHSLTTPRSCSTWVLKSRYIISSKYTRGLLLPWRDSLVSILLRLFSKNEESTCKGN